MRCIGKMNEMNETLEHKKEASWPYATLLLLGFFGTGDPAGKRLAWRTTGGLLLLIAAFIGAEAARGYSALANALLLTTPLTVAFLVWSYKEYLGALDELSRKIQLEAFAWAYGAALVVLVGWFALVTATGVYVSPLWILLTEGFRGLALVMVARRYA